ncbi:MAG: DUF4202 family protein [Acidobacteria bacterium]|nr:DUF4202 family protein [Acidobacteriota bacterium]
MSAAGGNTLRAVALGPALSPAFAALRHEFPGLRVDSLRHHDCPPHLAAYELPVEEWCAGEFDTPAADEPLLGALARGPVCLHIDGDGPPRAALEILTRQQRFVFGRNAHSAGPAFSELLALHAALHDLAQPLVAADYAHALDTWRWLLRLAPEAGFALQAAALLHDVERIVSEAERRIEQHAGDYARFKDAHAERSARLAAQLLARAGARPAQARRTTELVAQHERTGDDPELAALNDADALSFFSLNSCGFIAYYGPAHTRTKVAHTLERMSAAALARLTGVRLREDVRAILLAEIARTGRQLPDLPA